MYKISSRNATALSCFWNSGKFILTYLTIQIQIIDIIWAISSRNTLSNNADWMLLNTRLTSVLYTNWWELNKHHCYPKTQIGISQLIRNHHWICRKMYVHKKNRIYMFNSQRLRVARFSIEVNLVQTKSTWIHQ